MKEILWNFYLMFNKWENFIVLAPILKINFINKIKQVTYIVDFAENTWLRKNQ